jgi:phosphatidylglycerol:prolipoprotein diacylglycerol transferase
MERARSDFEKNVPLKFRRLQVRDLSLPEEIGQKFNKQRITTLGQIVLEWGLDPRRLGLSEDGQELVREELNQVAGMDETWLDDAPWRQWNPDFVWGGVAWCLVIAVIGARLYHVLTPSPSMSAVGIDSVVDYLRRPSELINIRSGGLGIYGAIVGGALGLILYTRRHHISAIAWADIAVVGLALGQFVGRWGNFFNQELYGSPSDLPWAVTIDPIHRLSAYVDVTRFHPAFLYESLWSLVTFFILLRLARRHRESLQTGDLMALYLVLYSVGRIMLELVRLDSRTITLAGVDLGVPVATLVSIIIAVPMAILLIYRHVIAKDK